MNFTDYAKVYDLKENISYLSNMDSESYKWYSLENCLNNISIDFFFKKSLFSLKFFFNLSPLLFSAYHIINMIISLSIDKTSILATQTGKSINCIKLHIHDLIWNYVFSKKQRRIFIETEWLMKDNRKLEGTAPKS